MIGDTFGPSSTGIAGKMLTQIDVIVEESESEEGSSIIDAKSKA
jgi:hypothetical protein